MPIASSIVISTSPSCASTEAASCAVRFVIELKEVLMLTMLKIIVTTATTMNKIEAI